MRKTQPDGGSSGEGGSPGNATRGFARSSIARKAAADPRVTAVCEPCIYEPPATSTFAPGVLSAEAGRAAADGRANAQQIRDFLVVISADEDREHTSRQLANIGLSHLGFYVDTTGALAREGRVTALPTTFVISKRGQVLTPARIDTLQHDRTLKL